MRWVGVDPGARYTGIVLRDGDRLLAWHVLDREAIEPCQERPTAVTFAAVETVVAPTPHLGLTRPLDTIDTAMLVGYLQAVVPDIVLVRPAGHGSRLLATYPRGLVTDRERTGGTGRPAPKNPPQSHARSAWDVAGAGPHTRRIRAAMAAAGKRGH